jgi:hypothetical protein
MSNWTSLDASTVEQLAAFSREDLIQTLLFLDGIGGEVTPSAGTRNGFRAAIDEMERRYPSAAELAFQLDGDDEDATYAQLLVRLSGEGK